jgi:hypothetical protein
MDESRSRVVVRYSDSRVLKGHSADFDPESQRFHLRLAAATESPPVEVQLSDLKAVFFVRDFGGDPRYNERKQFDGAVQPVGRKVEVTFQDGEVLVGSTTTGYSPDRRGVSFTPADPRSNNLRVFAVCEALRTVRYL